MRIHIDNLSAFVAKTIEEVRDGVKAANDAGISAELPDFVDFTGIEIIWQRAANSQTTVQANTGTNQTVRNNPQVAVVTTEAAATDVETGETATGSNQSESGQDSEKASYGYIVYRE